MHWWSPQSAATAFFYNLMRDKPPLRKRLTKYPVAFSSALWSIARNAQGNLQIPCAAQRPTYNCATLRKEQPRRARGKRFFVRLLTPAEPTHTAPAWWQWLLFDHSTRHKSPVSTTRYSECADMQWMRQQPNLPWGNPKVLSAQESLTSVFGMRTGGSSPLSSPQWLYNPHSAALYT